MSFVHKSSYVDQDVQIGEDTKIWHFSHILSKSRIGNACSIGQNCSIGPNVILGDRVKIQNNVSLYDGVVCEDEVFIGPSAVFTNVINPRSFVSRRHEFKRTLLKKGATIGANATIICGVTIGEYAFVGAGSTVTKDVPAFALVYGVPAHHQGWVSRLGNRLNFKDDLALDPIDGSRYRLQAGQVALVTAEAAHQCSASKKTKLGMTT